MAGTTQGSDGAAGEPFRQVRATFSGGSVAVYQAYSPAIAEPALAAGRFVPPSSGTG